MPSPLPSLSPSWSIVVVVARNDVTIIVDCVARGAIAKSEPKLGVNKTTWWPFIEITQYVSPLLHCEIGIGNDIFQLLWVKKSSIDGKQYLDYL